MASFSASAVRSLSSICENSEPTQPDRQMSPSLCWARISLSILRLVVISFLVRPRREPQQVAEPDAVLRQQGQVVRIPFVPVAPRARRPIGPLPGSDVRFDADDRDDPRRLRLAEELDRPEQVPVVRQRHRRHPQRLDPLDQVGDLARPVEQAVVAVAVQVDEGMTATSSGHSGVLENGATGPANP